MMLIEVISCGFETILKLRNEKQLFVFNCARYSWGVKEAWEAWNEGFMETVDGDVGLVYIVLSAFSLIVSFSEYLKFM